MLTKWASLASRWTRALAPESESLRPPPDLAFVLRVELAGHPVGTLRQGLDARQPLLLVE